MNQQMPQMPTMPSKPQSDASSSEFTDSEVSPSSAEGSAPSGVELSEDDTPEIINPVNKSANVSEVRSTPKRGIRVVATEKGFYNNLRREPGDEFIIKSEEDFGEWFYCVDPVTEAKRVDYVKNKKVKK